MVLGKTAEHSDIKDEVFTALWVLDVQCKALKWRMACSTSAKKGSLETVWRWL